MSREATIRALLATAGQVADDEAEAAARVAARCAWVKRRIADLRAAHDRVDEAWRRIFDALPEDLNDEEVEAIPPPPEQTELDIILAELNAVRDHDRWPKELYWTV